MLDERSEPSSQQSAAGAARPLSPFIPPPQPRRSAAFWFAIIAGGCILLSPVVLIVAAIGIPQFLKVRKTANEASAVLAMRTIGQAETNYNVTYPANGYACSLATLGGDSGSGTPTAEAAQLIDPILASTAQKSGYTFAITCGAKITLNDQDSYTSYQLIAVPLKPGKTGNRGYCSDQDGVIRFSPDGTANCTHLLP